MFFLGNIVFKPVNYLFTIWDIPSFRFFKSAAPSVNLSVHNPFDFFLEPQAENYPFEYTAEQLHELAPYLVRAEATEQFAKYLFL